MKAKTVCRRALHDPQRPRIYSHTLRKLRQISGKVNNAQPRHEARQLYNAMPAWYDCLRLNNRTLTDHEKNNLNRVDVKCVSLEGYDLVGPRESRLARPLFVEFTHQHNVGDLLAVLCFYVDPNVKSLCDYPSRHVRFAAIQQVDRHAPSPVSGQARPSQERQTQPASHVQPGCASEQQHLRDTS